jgi:F-type H+-transporting ATPase subunit delta
VNPTLQGYAAAVMESAGADGIGALADDLYAIDQLVLSNATLRAALSDTAVPGPARRAVVLDVLQGKVGEPARRLAAFGCMAVHAQDVVSAVSWLSLHVRQVADRQELEEPALSLTQSRQRVAGFATAVYEDMDTSELESLEDDLFRFARIVGATPELRSALTDRDLPVAARQGLVAQLLEGKVPATTLSLVGYAVAGGRARDFVGTLDFLVEQTALARGWRIARVRSARPIDDTQRQALTDALGSLAGGPVELQVEIDESLLSGARIRIGDLQVDATARGRIDTLREHLVPADWKPASFGQGARTENSTDPTEGTEGAQ